MCLFMYLFSPYCDQSAVSCVALLGRNEHVRKWLHRDRSPLKVVANPLICRSLQHNGTPHCDIRDVLGCGLRVEEYIPLNAIVIHHECTAPRSDMLCTLETDLPCLFVDPHDSVLEVRAL